MQKYEGRVILRGDNVKDDVGGLAVFTEQGAPACHPLKYWILFPLPVMSGEGNDAALRILRSK